MCMVAIGRLAHYHYSGMEAQEDLCMVGSAADGYSGAGWMYLVCDAILATPYHQYESTDSFVESLGTVFYGICCQKT